MGVQEVRWDKGGTVRAGDYNFSMEREMKITSWEQDFFVHQRIASAVKRVEFVSDRVSCIVMRGRWCNIIVVNVHAPSEVKIDESKDRLMSTITFISIPGPFLMGIPTVRSIIY